MILSIKVAAALTDVARVALLAELRHVAGIQLEADGRIHLEALYRIHAHPIEEVGAKEHGGRGQQHQRVQAELGQCQVSNGQAEQLLRAIHGGMHYPILLFDSCTQLLWQSYGDPSNA